MKIEVFNTKLNEVGTNLIYCGTEICEPSFCMEPHIRQEYLFHYVLSGSGTYTVNKKTYEIKPGTLFVIFPDTLVSYKNNNWDPFHFSWFSFSGENSEQICNDLGFARNKCVKYLKVDLSLNDIIEECVRVIHDNHKVNKYEINSYFYKILSIINNLDIDRKYVRNVQEEHAEKVASYIRMNYMLPITVQDAVNFAFLDRTYLAKIFRKYKGLSISEYISKVRINHAKTLLERTDYTSKEISAYVGFKDECYFSRVFKKTTGMKPLEYRYNHLNEKEEEHDI